MKTLQEIMKSNYEAVKNRGLIDDETTLPDFITKLQEEIGEFIKAKNDEEAASELADIVGVCLNIASHYEIDLPASLEAMVKRNEDRKKKEKNTAITVICETIGAFSWYNHELRGTVTPKKQDYGVFFDLMRSQTEINLISKDGEEIKGTFRISAVYIENEILYIDVYRKEFNKYEAQPSLRDLSNPIQLKQYISEKNDTWTVLIDAIHEPAINKSLYYKKPIFVWGIGYCSVTDYKHAPDGLIVDLIRSRP